MKKIIIISSLAFVLVIVGAKTLSKQSPSNASSANQSSASQSSPAVSTVDASIDIAQNNIDLGDIPITGGLVQAEFSFQNMGSEPIRLARGATSCMCTEAVVKKSDGTISSKIKMPGHGPSGMLNMEIAPGEQVALIATFDPMAHGPSATGPITRTVVIETNAKDTPEIEFLFRGNVVK